MPPRSFPPSPATVFLVLGVIAGGALFVASPPFRWGDENTHFRQAFRLAEGEARPACSLAEAATQPTGIVQLVYFASLLPKHGLISRQGLRNLGALEVRSDVRVPVQIQRAPYSPVPYASQAIAIGGTRLFTRSALTMFYAARIGNLLGWLALTWLAIRLVPGFGWSFSAVALCPMSMFLATACSVDASANALAFLWTAYVLHVAGGPGSSIGRSEALVLGALAAALPLTKTIYVVLVPLALVIPAARVGGRWRLVGLVASLLAVSCGAAIGWMTVAGPQCLAGIGVTSPESVAAQRRSLIDDPAHFLRVLDHTARFVGTHLTWELGDAKWGLAVPIVSARVLFWAVLVALLFDDGFPRSLSLARRAIAAATAVAGFVAVVLIAFVYWTPRGWALQGFQMRYLLPLLPAVLVALKPPTLPVPPLARRLVGCAATVAVAVLVGQTVRRGLGLFAP